MKRCIKLFVAFVLLLGVWVAYCHAGTYTSKENPQHSIQYEEAPGVYLTVGQCKDYSRQNCSGKIVSCRAMLFRHFYLDGEIVDDRMDEFARSPWGQIAEGVFVFIIIFLFIAVGLYVYMIPTFTAYSRNHPQRFFIMLLNLFLGNTVVGWVAALIWARGGEDKNEADRNKIP